MAKLKICNIGKDYGPFRAVDDFSLDVASGEFISLLGPSGCGKTTMLRIIAGFIPPSRGTIALSDRIISSATATVPPEERSMSMIFQSYAIWPHMTVSQNVAFGLELRHLPREEVNARVAAILDVVQLSKQAGRYPAELSGGQQQRVALARAIVIKPEVLLLDEPLSNLDANLRDEMRLEIRRMHDEFGLTTIYVTHDQSEAMVTSDRIVVMNAGRVEQIASPRALYRSPASRFVASFIGRTNFIDGRVAGTTIEFPDFQIPRDGSVGSVPTSGGVLAAIRPHSLRFGRPPHGEPAGAIRLPCRIEARAYYGDRWDYSVRLPSGIVLDVSTEPYQEHAMGAETNVTVDPSEIAIVPDDRENSEVRLESTGDQQ